MSRLPKPRGDEGVWGDVLNDFLRVEHNADGTLKSGGTLAAKANDDAVVHLSGAQNITGTKTFQSSPVLPAPTLGSHAATKSYVDSTASAGTPDADTATKGKIQLTGDLGGTAASPTVPGLAGKEPTIATGSSTQYYRGDKTWQTLDKGSVGLANVDNTSDANKPVSSATQTALSAKADDTATLHKAGTETVTGSKDFTGGLTVNGSAVLASAQRGVANGVASLGSNGKVPGTELDLSGYSTTTQSDAKYASATILSLVSQPGLVNWRANLAGRYLTPSRTVFIGSSTTAGNNATQLSRRFVERFTKIMQTSYNPAGIGGGTYYKAIEGWTTTGTTSIDTNGLGLASLVMTAGASISRTINPCTSFTVLYAQGTGAGAFTVSIDGGAATTITPSTTGAANQHTGSWQSATVTSGSHSITITATAATVIAGVYAANGDETSGVQGYNSGKGSMTSQDFANTATLYPRIGQLAPGLIVIMLGSNDYLAQMSIAAFTTNVQNIIANSKAAIASAGAPPASYLLVGSYKRLDVGSPTIPWTNYLVAMSSIAAADPTNVAFMDISSPYPTTNTATGDPWDLIDTDNVHQTDRGHALMADLMAQGLRIPIINSIAGTSLSSSPSPSTDPATISNLIAQFRADSLSLSDGAAVASWAPAAGVETAPAANATTANQPVYRTNQIGGKPAVTFTAANSQQLDTGAWGTSRPVPNTVFVVGKLNTTGTGNLFSGRNGVYCYIGTSTGANVVMGAGAVTEMGTAGTSGFHIYAGIFNGASSALHIDSRTATITGTTGTGASAALPGLRFGSGSTGTGSYLDGAVAELIVYNRALTSTEMTNVMTWLGTKYGITVA